MEQVRPVDQQAAGAGERVAVGGWAIDAESYASAGARLRSAASACSCSSTSTASSTAAPSPCPGVAAVLADRASRGDDVVYVTNNSMHYRADYLTRLAAMGAPVRRRRVVSSARATALYLRDHDQGIRRVLVAGRERARARAARRRLRRRHRRPYAATRMSQEGRSTAGPRPASPDAVVVGLDPHLTYLRLAAAADCIRAGAHFIATNRDPVYPTERGLRPGAGSLVAALEARHRRRPGLDRQARARTCSRRRPTPSGREPDEAIMIGDGLPTDLAAAHAVGARSVLMLTGVTTRARSTRSPPTEQPDRDRRRRGRARRDPRAPGRLKALRAQSETASDVRRTRCAIALRIPSRTAG